MAPSIRSRVLRIFFFSTRIYVRSWSKKTSRLSIVGVSFKSQQNRRIFRFRKYRITNKCFPKWNEDIIKFFFLLSVQFKKKSITDSLKLKEWSLKQNQKFSQTSIFIPSESESDQNMNRIHQRGWSEVKTKKKWKKILVFNTRIVSEEGGCWL